MKNFLFTLSVIFSLQANAQIISTVAGTGTSSYSGDGGQATSAELTLPTAVTTDASGNIYIADFGNSSLRKVNTSGIITTIAGNGGEGFSGDGGQATAAQLDSLAGVTVDAAGNIYITDTYNYRIRKINTLGTITTIAGNGTLGYSGDGGQATNAQLNLPNGGVAIDAAGNIYIADLNNSCVRKINTLGIISTIAGNNFAGTSGGFSGDGGQATAAALSNVAAIAFDAAGNLYISDSYNNRIRKIDISGIITTVAGIGSYGLSGDGGQATNAQLSAPVGITFDSAGNLYIADQSNNAIRMVNTIGIISTIAGGSGSNVFNGDGGLATNAGLGGPMGVAFDGLGNLYIADYFSNRIRKVSPALAITVNSPPLICGGTTTNLTSSGATTYSWSPATGLSATTGSTVVASPTVSTSYTVTGFSGAAAGIAISTVTVDLPPVTADSAAICISNSATLTASGATTYSWNTGVTGATIIASPTVTTNYTVVGTDANGCTNSFSTSVQIISSPIVSFYMQKDTLSLYTWDVYPNYSTNVISATWYWGDGSSTSGLYPNHTFSSPGIYNICLTVFNACGDSSNFCQNDSIYRLANSTDNNMIQVNVMNNNATGITTFNKQSSTYKIYPNPAQNNFTIETTLSEKQNVQVYDVNGKLVLSQTIVGTTNIDAGNFNTDVYNISIISKGSIVNRRLVVVK